MLTLFRNFIELLHFASVIEAEILIADRHRASPSRIVIADGRIPRLSRCFGPAQKFQETKLSCPVPDREAIILAVLLNVPLI
jgi:hypothetical protein